jgi:hypothetical protein
MEVHFHGLAAEGERVETDVWRAVRAHRHEPAERLATNEIRHDVFRNRRTGVVEDQALSFRRQSVSSKTDGVDGASRATRGPGRIQQSLHENEVEPAAELMAHLAEVRHTLETEALVKTNGFGIGSVDGAQHDVFVQRLSSREQRFDEAAPDSASAGRGGHVDGVLYGVAVTGPCSTPVAKARESDNRARIIGRNDYRIPGRDARLVPGSSLRKRRGFESVDCRRRRNDVVVDPENPGHVVGRGVADRHTGQPPSTSSIGLRTVTAIH